jgi:hypothetical protein
MWLGPVGACGPSCTLSVLPQEQRPGAGSVVSVCLKRQPTAQLRRARTRLLCNITNRCLQDLCRYALSLLPPQRLGAASEGICQRTAQERVTCQQPLVQRVRGKLQGSVYQCSADGGHMGVARRHRYSSARPRRPSGRSGGRRPRSPSRSAPAQLGLQLRLFSSCSCERDCEAMYPVRTWDDMTYNLLPTYLLLPCAQKLQTTLELGAHTHTRGTSRPAHELVWLMDGTDHKWRLQCSESWQWDTAVQHTSGPCLGGEYVRPVLTNGRATVHHLRCLPLTVAREVLAPHFGCLVWDRVSDHVAVSRTWSCC